jgi:hypothetical protein
MVIYENNDVTIEVTSENIDEATVNFNGNNLIWISRETQEDFILKLTQLFDDYRI